MSYSTYVTPSESYLPSYTPSPTPSYSKANADNKLRAYKKALKDARRASPRNNKYIRQLQYAVNKWTNVVNTQYPKISASAVQSSPGVWRVRGGYKKRTNKTYKSLSKKKKLNKTYRKK